MRKIGDLIEKAKELKKKGMRVGEIADELNVSKQTADWLVSQSGQKDKAAPKDLFVDWSRIGSDSRMLMEISSALSNLIDGEPEAMVGIAVSGLPLATLVAHKLDTGLAVFHPKKKYWEPGSDEEVKGALSSNFLIPDGIKVVIVDDIVTSGNTASETVTAMEEKGCEILCVTVVVDKSGLETVKGVPLKPLIRVGRV